MHKSLKNILKEEMHIYNRNNTIHIKYNPQFSSIETIQAFTERYPDEMHFDEMLIKDHGLVMLCNKIKFIRYALNFLQKS